jgi:ABC-type antimicrobial peptide transport system permease subunit
VIGDVLGQMLAGILIGLGLCLLATRALSGLLFQVAPVDPGSYAVVAVLLALAGLAAALGPGLRAARVDPVAALRWE